eukprot:1145581-Pelagomonas_calceolata.AAC.5
MQQVDTLVCARMLAHKFRLIPSLPEAAAHPSAQGCLIISPCSSAVPGLSSGAEEGILTNTSFQHTNFRRAAQPPLSLLVNTN